MKLSGFGADGDGDAATVQTSITIADEFFADAVGNVADSASDTAVLDAGTLGLSDPNSAAPTVTKFSADLDTGTYKSGTLTLTATMSEIVQLGTAISVELDTGDWVVLEAAAAASGAASNTYVGTVDLASLTGQTAQLAVTDYVSGKPSKDTPSNSDFAVTGDAAATATLQADFINTAKDIAGTAFVGLGAGAIAPTAMATEKLAEGIRNFTKDQIKLEALLEAKL